MTHTFATAARIIFGNGAFSQAGDLAASLGTRALIVAGSHPRLDELLDLLSQRDVQFTTFSVRVEPTVETARQGALAARSKACDLIIGLGGGSALDTGKAIAALLSNPGDPLDYLEVVGRGRPLVRPSAPFIAIPTTSGTGSEVTSNAVLGSPEHAVKVSMRSLLMLPRLALVDPELSYSMPPAVTASTGLDALTQVIEPYVSHLSNPMTDPLCLDGIRRVARSLLRAYESPTDAVAREDMALASLFGGLALSNAKLGAVHGFAGPFGGMLADRSAPHGAVCAALLPHVASINVRALRQRQPDGEALRRYTEVARILTGDPGAAAEDAAAWLADLVNRLNIPPLHIYGLSAAETPAWIEKSAQASSMKGNPIRLTPMEMAEIAHLGLMAPAATA